MVDFLSSSPLDATVDPGAPAGQPQYRSRRELREAEAAGRSAAVVAQPAVASPVVASPFVAQAPASFVSPPAVPAPVQYEVLAPVQSVVPAVPRPTEEQRSPAVATVPAVKSAASAQKRNPFSVLATMAVVGGMFAVAGLPAYATQEVATAEAEPVGVAQSVVVSDDAVASLAARDGFHATTPEQLEQANEDALRAAANEAYLLSGARELGDDYPWPYELTDDQGGGLSPLNYYFRECVDFVAWRINRDQGYYAAPFKWVWSNLTPFGGNGGQWQYNWESLGRTVSATPIPGAVAYTGGNHVAYVKSVNDDGTVTLEEYNYIPGMYSQRTIPASSVVSFLYPPS